MAFIFTMFVTILFCSCALFHNASSSETVQIETVTKPATCEKFAKKGDLIAMRYKGNLFNPDTKEVGKQFDGNFEKTNTLDFQLGAGQVIQGWEQGIPGMCVGETRKLTIPPSLAYGDRGFADLIPPKSTLLFEIQLKSIGDSVSDQKLPDGQENIIDANNDAQITSEEIYDLYKEVYNKKFNDGGEEKILQEDDKKNNNGASDKKLHHGHENGEHDHEQDSFSEIDTNKDKQITREEMGAYIGKFYVGGEDKSESIDGIVSQIFQEDDKNMDGVISIDEYQVPEDEEHEYDEEDDREEL